MAELGALSLRIQTEGDQQVLQTLNRIDTQAKATGVSAQTAAQALSAIGISAKVVNGEIVVTQQQLGAANSILQAMGSTAQATTKATGTLAGATRVATQAQAQQTVATGQTTVATQALATSQQQQTVATQAQTVAAQRSTRAITALGGQSRRTRGLMMGFGRDGRSAMLGLGFAISQMANTGEASLLSLARQITTITALLGGRLGLAGIIGAVGIGIFDFFRTRARIRGEIARDTAIALARDLTTIQQAQLQRDEAAQQLAFQRGLTSLRQFYDARRAIIDQNRAAERAALEAEARALSVPIAGESKQDTTARLLAREKAIAAIAALEAKAIAQQIGNVAELERAEREAAEALQAFEILALEARGQAHVVRMEQIAQEVREARRVPLLEGETAADREAALNRIRLALEQRAELEQRSVDLERLQTDLDTERLAIQNRVTAGKLTDVEAAQQVAEAERAALPDMLKLVDAAIALAAKLGDEGSLAALRLLRVELEGLGTALSPFEQRVQAAFNTLAADGTAAAQAVADRLREMIAEAGGTITLNVAIEAEKLVASFNEVKARFAAAGTDIGHVFVDVISAAASGGSGSKALLAGLGGIFSEMGRALTIYGLTMMGLLPTFSNPFTAGPAALAAGIALTALGAALGGAATGRGGAAATTAVGPAAGPPIRIDRLIVDPNAGQRERVATSAGRTARAIAPAQTQTFGRPLVVDSPEGKRVLTQSVGGGVSRGIG